MFVNSLFIKLSDREGVEAICGTVLQGACWVTPVNNGYIGIFTENSGESERLATQLSSEMNCPVIAFDVFEFDGDEDEAQYHLYINGNQVEFYSSNSLPSECPCRLSELIGADTGQDEIRNIISSNYCPSDIITAIASAIGVNDMWAPLSHKYLSEHGDIITAFDQFHHIP